MSAAPILTILKNGETIRKLPIEGEALLGRSENCLIRLEDRAISRQHVAFKLTAAGVQVEKKSVFAPLLVNGKDCTRALLKEGDIISLGPYMLTLASPQATASVAAPASLAQTAPIAPLAEDDPFGNNAAPRETAAGAAVDGEPGDPVPAAPILVEEGAQEGAQDHPDGNVQLDDFGAAGESGAEAPAELSADPAGQPALQLAQPEAFEAAQDDARTKLVPSAKIAVRLVFEPGQANVQEFELTGAEISIGRGKNCDIVLNDKKASRKHTLIRKAGVNFVLKDLGSSNGTLVNGARVTETELSGDDVIRIGDTEFRFVATSSEYEAQKNDFLTVEPIESPSASMDLELPEISLPESSSPPEAQVVSIGGGTPSIAWPDQNQPGSGLANAATGSIPGLGGIAGVGTPQGDGSLLGKFRALPKRTRIIVILFAGAALYTFMDVDTAPKKKTDSAQSSKIPKVKTYDTLSAKEKAWVDSMMVAIAQHFQKGDYDSTIDGAKQVLALIPNYDQAVDYENLATQKKEAVRRAEEARRAREEAERLKLKIAELVEETRKHMEKKQYDIARELFAEILSIDPDNAEVAEWRRQLDELAEAQRMRAQEEQVRAEINRNAWAVYREGLASQKAGNHHQAIRTFTQVLEGGATDKKVLKLAAAGISESRDAVAAQRDPLMAEAKQAEDSSEFAKAYQLYYQASEVDPAHKEAREGMSRLKSILHEKAKGIYTEAVLAESYSDFVTARQKFKECQDTAPRDDIYYERATRKLANYSRLDESMQ